MAWTNLWRRVRRLLVILCCIVLVGILLLAGYLKTGHPDRLLHRRLVESLTEVFGRSVEIESIRVHYLPPSVTIEGLRTDAPVVTAQRVEAVVSAASLLRGRLRVTELTVERPTLKWNADTERLL